MSIWFFFWLLLSGALLFFLGWMALVLYRQRQAWQAFAKAYKLRYGASRALGSPELNGEIDGHKISFFTGEHVTADARGVRKLAAVEVHVPSVMPSEGAIASGGMVPVAQGLGFQEEFRPADNDWKDGYIATGQSKAMLENYLTPERLRALLSLMKIKNGWVILIFRGDTTLLRFDTPDPLDSEKKLEAITKKMIKAAKILTLEPGEESRLKTAKASKPKNKMDIPPQSDGSGGLELEEDEG